MKTENKKDIDVKPAFTIKIIKQKLPTTDQMVDNALIKLHKRKGGISLKLLYNSIIQEYTIEKTSKRYNLVKKRLIKLKEMGYIVNKTGRGLLGCFKLLNKNEFVKEFISKKNNKKPKRKTKPNTTLKKSLKRKSNVPHNSPTGSQIHSPTDSNADHFNSWILPNHANNSTPFMEVVEAPPAPVVAKRVRKRMHEDNLLETPRSSKGKSGPNDTKT